MLESLPTVQLQRIYRRLYSRVAKDCFGADWRTLKITRPALCKALRSVDNELQRRWNAKHAAAGK